MKIKSASLIGAILALCVSTAQAQFDLWGAPRTLQLVSPSAIVGASLLTTNTPVDAKQFVGQAQAIFFVRSNGAGGTLTAQIEGSDTGTNAWAPITYALATSTSVISTNYASGYGTNSATYTNTYLLPGTIVRPTAYASGFATPYLSQAEFTNTGALTVTSGGIYAIGWSIEDSPRFLHVVWTPGGSATNFTVGAVLIGRRQSPTAP